MGENEERREDELNYSCHVKLKPAEVTSSSSSVTSWNGNGEEKAGEKKKEEKILFNSGCDGRCRASKAHKLSHNLQWKL